MSTGVSFHQPMAKVSVKNRPSFAHFAMLIVHNSGDLNVLD